MYLKYIKASAPIKKYYRNNGEFLLKMGRAELVQTQLHTNNGHINFDRPGRTFAIVGPRGRQVRAKCYRIGYRVYVHGSLQYIFGRNYTYRHEL